MHILFLVPMYPNKYRTNSNIFFEDQVNALAKNRNNRISVLAVIPIKYSWFKDNRFICRPQTNVEHYDNVSAYKKLFYSLPRHQKYVSKMRLKFGKMLFRKIVNDFGIPDIIHAQTYLVSLLAQYLKRKYLLPLIYTEHYSVFFKDEITPFVNYNSRIIIRDSDEIISVSNALSKRLEYHFDTESHVIPNLVDIDYFKPLASRQNKNTVFTSVGHLTKNKNQKDQITAFIRVFGGDEKIKLYIGGSGVEFNNLKKLCSDIDINKQVHLLGSLNRHQVLELLQKSNYFVLSSHFETFGIVLIEAMSCGLPVISSKCGGSEDIVTNETGIIYNNSIIDLSQSMREIITKKYDQLAIRNLVAKRYSSDTVREKIEKIYEIYVK